MTAALTLGSASSCGIRIFRCSILFGPANTHATAAPTYQKLILNMRRIAIVGLILSVIGLVSSRVGHACNDFDEFMLGFAPFLSLFAICSSLSTVSFTRHAAWLKASS